MKRYVFHTDPGHGWLAVKERELQQLGIADKITPYSYQNGGTVYLEEDCDFATFACAYEEHYGARPQYRATYREHSPIRRYQSYRVK